MPRQPLVAYLGICLAAGLSMSGRAQDAKVEAAKKDLEAAKDAKVEAAKKVDFAKDVMPLFRQNCIECHGPKKQESGMRLDRRSSAMNLRRRIVPGGSANSRVYYRLVGVEYGPQMPPTGALGAEQIAIIKAWIDQGADWPDALANERAVPPLNPKAVAMVEALRSDELPRFLKAAHADPNLLNERGPEGSTPFMYAVLYSNTETLASS
jgi:mono/diheme cytochrome c family protein